MYDNWMDISFELCAELEKFISNINVKNVVAKHRDPYILGGKVPVFTLCLLCHHFSF